MHGVILLQDAISYDKLFSVCGSCVLGPCNVNVVLSVLSSFAIILLRKREMVARIWLSSCCHLTACVLCLFLLVPWVNLWSVFVVVPGHTL